MTSKTFESYLNYITIADANKSNFMIYFYIKNFGFRKLITLISSDKSIVFPHESSKIENDLKIFKMETSNVSIPQITKDMFTLFLENFYKQFNFEQNDLKTFQICRDITEIITIFGPLDDLWKSRSKIFFYKKNYFSGLF